MKLNKGTRGCYHTSNLIIAYLIELPVFNEANNSNGCYVCSCLYQANFWQQHTR